MMRINLTVFSAILAFIFASCSKPVTNPVVLDRIPVIFPDYTDITIPLNIAPMNFRIREAGNEFEVRISASGITEKIRSKDPLIKIGHSAWRKLLGSARGGSLSYEVFVKGNDGKWTKFKTFENQVSPDKIDSHLAYRLINTGYVFWSDLGIYQRNLENFDEDVILENQSFDYGCLNCHSFCMNDPGKMMLHIRAVHGGTVVDQDGILTKIDTKNKYTLNAGVYPCWHPDGHHIAFSVNNINQHFCNGETRIEVSDEFSDIVVYDVETNTITTSPKVSTESRENLPVWSPDGKYLYFISAPPATDLESRIYTKYDLLRIGFNATDHSWGDIDTVLTSSVTRRSISFPKVSPGGRYLMFCTSDFGYFTIHHSDTDLYLLDLETGDYHKMEVNSDQTDSYHCFSHDGKWFVFSSKRLDGLFTRPYFSHLDAEGKATKPFVLPVEDPEFYNTFIKNYNVPELITGPVDISPLAIRDKVLETAIPSKIDPAVDTLYMKKHLARQAKF
jgi:hypothetical protein